MTENSQEPTRKIIATLSEEQKQQIMLKIENLVNTKLASLEARIKELEDASQSVINGYKHVTKISDHAINNCAEKAKEIQAIKIDLIELSQKIDAMRDFVLTGQTSMQKNETRLTEADFKRLAPIRLQIASLEEVVKLCEGS